MPLPVSMDATWLDGSVQFNGQELRRADAALFGGDGSALGVRGGIVRHGDTSLAVTVNASDLITVQPGAVAVPGNAGVGNGVYRAALAAADTGQLAARNATNPRIDLVIFRVLDTSVVGSHAAYTGRIEVLTGVAAASPAVPALPTLAVELARITVPATGGGTATVDSTYRQYASSVGGMLPVGSFARLPASAAKGQQAVALDTGARYYWDGALWLPEKLGIAASSATSQSVPSSGWVTNTNWTGLQYLPAANSGIVNLGSGRFQLTYGGWYACTAYTTVQGGGSGVLRAGRIYNELGATQLYEDRGLVNGLQVTSNNMAWEGRLAANSIIRFDFFHDHSGNLNYNVGGASMSIRRIAD